jgi:hypothetical protein
MPHFESTLAFIKPPFSHQCGRPRFDSGNRLSHTADNDTEQATAPRIARSISLLLSFAAVAVVSSRASAVDIGRSLRRETQCMVRVLQAMPDVDHIRSGISLSEGNQAFVEYRYHGSNGQAGTVRFTKQPGDLGFFAVLGGLMTPNAPGPPDFGTAEITRRWKSQCRVNAYIRFE